MPSQLEDFRGMMQTGQELSLESTDGTTIIFTGQGSIDGYPASTGSLIEEMVAEQMGVFMAEKSRAYRVLAALIENAVEIVEEQTKLTENNRVFRVEKVSRRVNDPCLYLTCKEI